MVIRISWDDLQVDEITRKIKDRVLTFSTIFCQRLNNEMVFATPVRFGFLRGSWFNGLNDVPSGVGSQDPSGGDTTSRLNAVVLTMTLGDVYYLVNTAVYAARMEYGFFGRDSLGRMYNQAGRGFVRDVVARSNEIADAVATEVGAGTYDA